MAFSESKLLSSNGNSLSNKNKDPLHSNHIQGKELGVGRDSLSSTVANKKEIRLRGLEPLTFGSVDRQPNDASHDNTITCEATDEQLTPQLTPESQKQAKIDTSKLPSDLVEIVAAWPSLPTHIKAAIKALIKSNNKDT